MNPRMHPSKMIDLAAQVLARPHALVDTPDSAATLARLAPPLLVLIAGGGGLFGAAIGSYHGSWQLLFAAVKMPLVLLAPVIVCVPALRVVLSGGAAPVSASRAGLAALVAGARIAVLASALVPLFLLAYSISPSYPLAVMGMVAGLLLVGLPGLLTLTRALAPRGRTGLLSMGFTVALVGLVLAQSGWLLRPFVVQPQAPLSMLCPVTENVFAGLADRTIARARGDEADRPWDCDLGEGSAL